MRDWLRRLHDEVHVTTVFVTHDQEEALEVSNEIVVINNGRVEQIGSPDDLYDHPANEFVMSFLGSTTRLDGHLLRPHDVDVSTTAATGSVSAKVDRVLRIGFEVRVDAVRPVAGGGDEVTTVQLTRKEANRLDLREGDEVWLSPAPGATTVIASAPISTVDDDLDDDVLDVDVEAEEAAAPVG